MRKQLRAAGMHSAATLPDKRIGGDERVRSLLCPSPLWLFRLLLLVPLLSPLSMVVLLGCVYN